MTNAPLDWLSELKTALMAKEEGEWEGISTSWDLQLDWEQRNLAQTIDMMIGHRSQVFIGNGVCVFPLFLLGETMADIWLMLVLEYDE